jgi:hypothetical protein
MAAYVSPNACTSKEPRAMDINTLVQSITAESDKKDQSTKIFLSLKPETQAIFLKDAKVVNGVLAHFEFSNMEHELTFNQFVTFLTGVGIDLEKFARYYNWECFGIPPHIWCVPATGKYCDPATCHET